MKDEPDVVPGTGNPSVVIPCRLGAACHTESRDVALHLNSGCDDAVVLAIELQRWMPIQAISGCQGCRLVVVLVSRTEITREDIAPFVHGLAVPHFFAQCSIEPSVSAQPDRQVLLVAYATRPPWPKVKRNGVVHQQQCIGTEVGQLKTTHFNGNAIGHHEFDWTKFIGDHGNFIAARIGNQVFQGGVGHSNVVGGQIRHLDGFEVSAEGQLHLGIAVNRCLS